jgi:hypothetical protein
MKKKMVVYQSRDAQDSRLDPAAQMKTNTNHKDKQ